MTRSLKTEAVVLKRRSLANKDETITLFTQESGKLIVFAKGVRKISSKRLPHLQTSNLIKAFLYQKDDKFYLQETSLISAFSAIKNSAAKMKTAYLLLYIIDRITPEQQKESNVYSLLKKFLIDLSKSTEKFTNTRLDDYLHRLLKMLGYVDTRNTLTANLQLIEELTGQKLPPFMI